MGYPVATVQPHLTLVIPQLTRTARGARLTSRPDRAAGSGMAPIKGQMEATTSLTAWDEPGLGGLRLSPGPGRPPGEGMASLTCQR